MDISKIDDFLILLPIYTVGASTIWGDGFLERRIIDYALALSFIFLLRWLVGPRQPHDRQNFPPNSIIHMLGGAGFLWLGWTGFNGGSPFAADLVAFHWPFSTLIFALQPASWRFAFFQSVDDKLAVFHTHVVAGLLGGVLSGIFAKPALLKLMFPDSTRTVDLRMKEDDQEIGDDAVHGEEAYAR
ncbi:hypothetical protein DKX38_007639 [Salix brachista]|uniref:Ammonium transporter AmtB-like domain-containing protein n=1 Tax=Salix brachista TaxID=2182728 RepID=A0A5N5MNH0_9ROSI|nr:hypothetical protein DKX38_007639 [Salix brachista]